MLVFAGNSRIGVPEMVVPETVVMLEWVCMASLMTVIYWVNERVSLFANVIGHDKKLRWALPDFIRLLDGSHVYIIASSYPVPVGSGLVMVGVVL